MRKFATYIQEEEQEDNCTFRAFVLNLLSGRDYFVRENGEMMINKINKLNVRFRIRFHNRKSDSADEGIRWRLQHFPLWKRTISITLIILSILTAVSDCLKASGVTREVNSAVSPFYSYREIPGVNPEEIEAIESVLKETGSFSYGMTPASEAYYNETGEVSGFSALVADWLTMLFGIQFRPEIYEWDELINGLNSYDIDFVGNLTISDERKQIYYMTDAIARRAIGYMRIAGSAPLSEIARIRPLRYAFLYGATTYDFVFPHITDEYEHVFAKDYGDAYNMLKRGEVDAFIAEKPNEAAFDIYDDVVSSGFFPPIYLPIAFATANPKLKPIITVIQKALENGGAHYLVELYNTGEQEYIKHKFSARLSDEEREYIRNNPVIPVAVEPGNYPISFYNTRENKWQGIALDVLDKVAGLTGLRFEQANDKNATWVDLLKLMENGEASMVTELMEISGRDGKFLWSDVEFMNDNVALISKSDYRNILINEIIYVKVGIVKDTAFDELFREWFPNHPYLTEYNSTIESFDALDRGEVDMIMTSMSKLLMMTHYMERADFQLNFVFDYPFQSTFGFDVDEEILCSIIDKALYLIDTETISSNWIHKTYDYRAKVVEAQRPWLVGETVLLIFVLILLFIIIQRKNSEGQRLAALVAKQTEEVRKASKAKSDFLANMNHEIRTPVNVIVGLTELLLEEDTSIEDSKEYLEKINTAGSILVELISDILDISKIESGKFTLNPTEYEIPSLLNDVVTLNTIRIGEKPITFSLDIGSEVYANLNGDDLAVKQILNNLLSNAFKYTREGTVTLSVKCEREDNDVVKLFFSVSDTGIGIREEDIKKLYADYNQVDTRANRTIEGTGLGLVITKKLVELMDGEISLESEYGKGSTFSVYICQGFVNEERIDTKTVENLQSYRYEDAKKAANRIKRPDLSWAKVLVVDDYKANHNVTKGLLVKYKIKADCVSSGQEAIDLIKLGQPVYDLVFMDHMMPGMDGIETTERIRALGTEYAETVTIIAFTANTVAGNEKVFLERGFQAFLPKPLSVKNLDTILRRWLMKKPSVQVSQPDSTPSPQENPQEDVAQDISIVQSDGIPTQSDVISSQSDRAPSEAPFEIPGVNVKLGLSLYDNDMFLYLDIMRIYVENMPEELEKLRNPTEETLQAYAIDIHTIKGSSASIGAREISERAKKLETLAKNRDLESLISLNDEFIRDTEKLVGDVLYTITSVPSASQAAG